jgi:hypothetical protein
MPILDVMEGSMKLRRVALNKSGLMDERRMGEPSAPRCCLLTISLAGD